jgi:hypothetical protein
MGKQVLSQKDLQKFIQIKFMFEPMDNVTLAYAEVMVVEHFANAGISCRCNAYYTPSHAINLKIEFDSDADRTWWLLQV